MFYSLPQEHNMNTSWLDRGAWLCYEHEMPHPYLIFGCFHMLQTSWFLWKLFCTSDSLGNYGRLCLNVTKERKIKMLHCPLIQVDLLSYYQQSRLFFSKGMTPGFYLHISLSETFQRNLFPRKYLFCSLMLPLWALYHRAKAFCLSG